MDVTRAAEVAAAFDLGEPAGAPTFVARGAMGRIWRLEVLDGRRWAVKELFEWAGAWEQPRDVLFQLAAADAGIDLPRPRMAVDGRAVVDGMRVYEWVDLAPPLAPPIGADTVTEVGTILGKLHALALEATPPADVGDWYQIGPTFEELDALADRATEAGRTWAGDLRARLPRLRQLADLSARSPMRTDDVIICHRDLTVDNLFRPASGGRLLVLDWENAGPLSAEAELAITVARWCTPATEDALLDAYATSGGTAAISGPASYGCNVTIVLNYLRVLAEQALDDDGHREFAELRLAGQLRDRLETAVPRGWAP